MYRIKSPVCILHITSRVASYLLDAYTSRQLVYEWQEGLSVNFIPGMTLSQFDLMGSPYRNLTFVRREGEFSVLQVSFNLQRHAGYFLIQVIAHLRINSTLPRRKTIDGKNNFSH